MKKLRGFTLIEILITISIINILASVAIAIYADYTKKARTAEVPPVLKALTKIMIEHSEDVEFQAKKGCAGKCYPDNIEETGFTTNNGTTFGTYFEYRINSEYL